MKYIIENPMRKPGQLGTRPVYIYLFGENKEWNSTDDLKIFGKVKVWKFRTRIKAKKSFYMCEKILTKLPNLSSITINLSKDFPTH